MSARPRTCAGVEWREYDTARFYEAEVGDELWDPKAGEGHVIVAEVPCNAWNSERDEKYGYVDCGCGGWLSDPKPHTALVCECGQDDSWRDHHYELLAKR